MLPNPWSPSGAAVFLMVIPCACSHAALQQETRLLTEKSIIHDRCSDSRHNRQRDGLPLFYRPVAATGMNPGGLFISPFSGIG